VFREVEHPLDGRAQPQLLGLSEGDALAQGHTDLPRRAHGAETAGEEQQLTPCVDQQRDLVVDCNIFEERQGLAPLDYLVESVVRDVT